MRKMLVLGVATLLAIGGFAVVEAAPDGATASVTVPTDPYRILDTRSGIGTGGVVGRLGPGQSITLQVAGVGPVPADATGVVLNLTVDNGDAVGSYITAWPTGSTRPDTSVINIVPGQATANMITANLGGGKLDLYNFTGHVNLIADVAAYLVPVGSSGGGTGLQGPPGPPGPTAGSYQSRRNVSRQLTSNDYVALDLQDSDSGGLLEVDLPARVAVNATVTITGAPDNTYESAATCRAEIKPDGTGAFQTVGVEAGASAGFGDFASISVVAMTDVDAGTYAVRVLCTSIIAPRATVVNAAMTVIAVGTS